MLTLFRRRKETTRKPVFSWNRKKYKVTFLDGKMKEIETDVKDL